MTESTTGLTISVIVPVHNGENFHHWLSQYKNLFHYYVYQMSREKGAFYEFDPK